MHESTDMGEVTIPGASSGRGVRPRVRRQQLIESQRLLAIELFGATSEVADDLILDQLKQLAPSLGFESIFECGGGGGELASAQLADAEQGRSAALVEVASAVTDLSGLACVRGPDDVDLYLAPVGKLPTDITLVGVALPGHRLDVPACFAFETIAGLIGSARARFDAEQALRRRLELQSFLASLESTAAVSDDEDSVLGLLESARVFFGVRVVSLWEGGDSSFELMMGASANGVNELDLGTRVEVEPGILGSGYLVVPMSYFEPDRDLRQPPDSHVLVVPCLGPRGTEGAVVFSDPGRRSWSDDEIAVAQSIAHSVQRTISRQRRQRSEESQALSDSLVQEISVAAARASFAHEQEFFAYALAALADHVSATGASMWRRGPEAWERCCSSQDECGVAGEKTEMVGSESVALKRWLDECAALPSGVPQIVPAPPTGAAGEECDRVTVVPVVVGAEEAAVLAILCCEGCDCGTGESGFVAVVGRIFGHALGRFGAEREVHRRLSLEVLVRRIATTAAEATGTTLDAALTSIVGDLGESLGLFAASVWRAADGRGQLRASYRLDQDGPPIGMEIELNELPALSRGWMVIHPHEFEAGRILSDPRDSSVLVTSFGDGESDVELGALIAVPHGYHFWTEEEITALRSIADIVSLLVRRVDAASDANTQRLLTESLTDVIASFVEAGHETADKTIAEALERIRSQLGCSSVALFELDYETLRIECSCEAIGGGDPAQAAFAPLDRDDPVIARILEPGAGPEWSLNDLIGMPDGPVETRVLAIPVVRGREILIVSAISRRGVPFSADAERALRSLSDLLAQLRSRLLLESLSRKRGAADRMLSAIAADFGSRSVDDANVGIGLALEKLGTLFGGLRSSLWRLDESGGERIVAWHGSGDGAADETKFVPHESAIVARLLRADHADTLEVAAEPSTGGESTHTVVFAPLSHGDGVFAALTLEIGRPLHMVVDAELQCDVADSVGRLILQLWRRIDSDSEIGRKLVMEDLLRRFVSGLVATSAEDAGGGGRALRRLAASLDLEHLSVWRTATDVGQTTIDLISDGGSVGHRLAAKYQHRTFKAEAAAELPHLLLERGSWPLAETPDGLRDLFLPLEDENERCIGFLREGDVGQPFFTHLIVSRRGSVPIDDHVFSILSSAMSTINQHHARVIAERSFNAAFECAPIAISIREADTRLIACNTSFTELTGRTEAELIGTKVDALLLPDQVEAVEADLLALKSDDQMERELATRRPDGSIVWARVRSTLVTISAHSAPVVLSYVEDVTEQRRNRQMLEFQATHDDLTSLPNRRSFVKAVAAELNSNSECAVLVLDLDRFKVVNDSLGHSVGDQLLVTCSDRIRLSLRPGDAVCRLGGDEFAILLRAPAEPNAAIAVADRLLSLLSQPVDVAGEQIFPTASIGIAIPDGGDSVDDLLRYADSAMYQAKGLGRDQWVRFDDSLREALAERVRTESDLRRAIGNGQLEVHYQPEYMLDTGAIVGTEALVRWRHPERGLLTAGSFVGLAEETGLVVDLGRWVLEKATMQGAAWVSAGHDIVMRVNISARQLRPAVVGEVQDALRASGLASERLCLEVTETAIMNDVTESAAILQQFRDLGVKIAVDDFGTGFSSLAYLKRLPVDILKIDRTFVDGICVDSDDAAIVQSIIGLAHTLRLDVVAEGIERPDQITELIQLGCRRGQGFLLAMPSPADEIDCLLVAQSEAR